MQKKHALVGAVVASTLLLSACGGGPGGDSGKISDDKVVLGVINDASGIYKDLSGPNSVAAVEMAVADYTKKYGDDAVATNIEVVSADHQNKPDVANTKAREMYERQKADAIFDVPSSAAALAVATQAENAKKVYINVGGGTSELTGAQCNRYTFHWAYDTYMLANGTATTVTKNGGKKWSIIYPDYEFGQTSDALFTAAIEENGGTVGEHIATPFPNDNFATFLTKAGAGDPDVIGTMQGGGDLVNLVKQFNQSGLKDKVSLAAGVLFLSDIRSLGVSELAGTTFTDAWYWNFDDQNRAWSDRFLEETGARPTSINAGNYSAASNYLETIQELGTDNADEVVDELEGKKIDDFFLRNGEVRAQDHRVVHDVYLAQVKPESEMDDEWDYEDIVKTIPADQAFRPVSSDCQL